MIQLLLFLFAPLGKIPALAPLGIELLCEAQGCGRWPIYLTGAAIYFAILFAAYRRLVAYQAMMFQRRKWKILETVTDVGN